MIRKYTISIFTENFFGLLNRITIIFTRRRINIESLTVSESEVKGVHRYTLVIKSEEEKVKKLVKQIEKLVDVLKAFYYINEETVFQEIALYKVSTHALKEGRNFERLIRDHHARMLTVESEFVVIEKTGHKEETQELLRQLQPFGVLEFARSGRVAVSKPMKKLSSYLREMEEEQLVTA
ncbi:acetolactate synthase small subunit [Fulvivirga kasyanovii]|uniref:Acetolactate synthase small subunit n=1 Tax=Fulvivirga kasyanovii TaxID=396812 RepID=A0ABW9RKR5_9BACT|nr:acetolactate synthase small subunit [Fulvivirga kasyanovii]MTI24689.1 acetolactate synthase small subunit [Fulvivirga kasyanovii]